MGELSERAEFFNSQHEFNNNMHSQLMVEAEGKFYSSRHTYGGGTLVHVEDMLLHQLDTWWGYANIPVGTKIVLYGNWSPCKHCIEQTIPNALAQMNIIERNLRIRFRFNYYYTQDNWKAAEKSVRADGGGTYFWESGRDAQNAYDQLASIYGSFSLKDISTPQQVMSSTSPRVAFIPGLRRSRSVTMWNEMWRGKLG